MPRKPPQAPLTFDIEPSRFAQEAKEIITASDAVWNKVAAIPPGEATFATAIQPIIHDENARGTRTRHLSWMRSVATSKRIRDASLEFHETMSADSNARWCRKDIFAVVDAVWAKQEHLDPESQLYLDKMRQDLLSSGLGLEDAAASDRIKAIQEALPKLATQYIKNLDQDPTGMWFTLEELRGVPERTLSKWKQDGERRFVNRRLPSIDAIYASAESGETRKTAWIDYENRVGKTNPGILKEILALRDEKSRLLSISHWAEYREKDRFVSTVEASSHLESMRVVLSDLARRDVQAMQDEKARHLQEQGEAAVKRDDARRLFHWDKAFYRRRLIKREFDLDAEKVAEYFPFWGSLDRLLQIFEAVFSIRFEKYPDGSPDIQVWHEDVKAYSVWNDDENGGGFLGFLYLDPFPRDDKYGHKGHMAIQQGSTKEDSSRHYPSAVVVANYTPPTDDRPSLLKSGEVVSLFHEIGHALHNLLSKTNIGSFHGTAVPRDFVEVPSKMLEHVFWSRELVRMVSGHFQSSNEEEKLPDEMLDKLIESRFAYVAQGGLSNMLFSLFDLKIHTPESHEALVNMNLPLEFNKMRKELSLLQGPEDLGFDLEYMQSYCRMRFPIGYSSAYYTYLLSDTFSYDIFESKFRPHLPTDRNAKSIRELISNELRDEFGRYRRQILQPGGSQPSIMKMLTGYLGREPSAAPYLDMLKATAATK